MQIRTVLDRAIYVRPSGSYMDAWLTPHVEFRTRDYGDNVSVIVGLASTPHGNHCVTAWVQCGPGALCDREDLVIGGRAVRSLLDSYGMDVSIVDVLSCKLSRKAFAWAAAISAESVVLD